MENIFKKVNKPNSNFIMPEQFNGNSTQYTRKLKKMQLTETEKTKQDKNRGSWADFTGGISVMKLRNHN